MVENMNHNGGEHEPQWWRTWTTMVENMNHNGGEHEPQ